MLFTFTSEPLFVLSSHVMINISWETKGSMALYIFFTNENYHGYFGLSVLFIASTLTPSLATPKSTTGTTTMYFVDIPPGMISGTHLTSIDFLR